VGNRARIFGLNTIGLARRGLSPAAIASLRQAYRHLLQLNTSHAIARIEQDPALASDEVRYLVDFIRHTQRGVTLRRGTRRPDEGDD